MTTSSVRDLFESATRDTSEGFRVNCPRCDDNEHKFYYNEEKEVGCCFHEHCLWYKDKGGVTEARLRAFFGDSTPLHRTSVERVAESDVEMPEHFRKLRNLPTDLRESVTAYLESRGLSERVLHKANVGYCDKGKLWGYIVFPIYRNGELVFWQARRFKNRTPKFRNPTFSTKGSAMFEWGDSVRPRHGLIVESVMNALTMDSGYGLRGWRIFAILTKSLTEEQRNRIFLYERYMEDMTVALDSDAWKSALDIAKALEGVIPVVRVATMPDERDLNELGREEAWEIVRKAILYRRDQHQQLRVHGTGRR